MLMGRSDWFLGCCRRDAPEIAEQTLYVLSSENALPLQHQSAYSFPGQQRATFSQPETMDSFSVGGSGVPPIRPLNMPAASKSLGTPATPRQRELRDSLNLPQLRHYPAPPNVSPEDSEDTSRLKLLEMYQEFALELFTGMPLTQLTSDRDYSDTHCQLMEDFLTLKLDQSNGRIIEFPLTGISKVYRIVKSDEKWYSPQSTQGVSLQDAEHIVIVEFLRRKLAFVFGGVAASQRFLTCMELLVRRARQQEPEAERSLRPLYPAWPVPSDAGGMVCSTPRQIQEMPCS